MKIVPMIVLGVVIFFLLVFRGAAKVQDSTGFQSNINSIPSEFIRQMKQYTWHAGCPVPISDLRYVTLTYWGFDHREHLGVLILNKAVAEEVVTVFKSLYKHRFPIQQMEPMETYKGDDAAAMSDNNTSAFVCRKVTGQPGIYSQHSYGRAIDINPKLNPYVKGELILPAEGAQFVQRNQSYPGMIVKDSLIYKLFIQQGWDWGGSWFDVQDYQHFEKRANGKKRNPFGYEAIKE